MADPGPLCGDPTCEGPGCDPAALDAHFARQERDARILVRSALGLPLDSGDTNG